MSQTTTNNSNKAKTIEEVADQLKKKADELGIEEKLPVKNEEEEAEAPLTLRERWEIEATFTKLFMDEPFLGEISAGITKVANEKQPTAYVGVRPNGKSHEIMMGYNPKFLRAQNDKKRAGVVRHELMHIVLQHIFTRSIGEKSLSVLWNWATDMAINSLIGEDNLPDMCIVPGKAPIDPKTGEPIDSKYAEYIANAPHNESSDFYFAGLRKIQDELGDNDNQIAIGSGIGTMDDHDGWNELPKDIQDQIEDKIRGLIQNGAERAERSNKWGTVPQEMIDYIRRMLSKQVDWRSILRNFIGRTRTLERNSTIRKINKKMPYVFPGVKRPLRANFACFIDQSGSMSDEDIALLFGELEGLANLTTLDLYHFDTALDLDSHQVWKRGMPYPNPERTRCGGTDFQCVADFCNEPENRGKWSGIIILTDGYAPTMGAIVGSKVLWVITEHGTKEAVRPGDLAVQMSQEKKFKEY